MSPYRTYPNGPPEPPGSDDLDDGPSTPDELRVEEERLEWDIQRLLGIFGLALFIVTVSGALAVIGYLTPASPLGPGMLHWGSGTAIAAGLVAASTRIEAWYVKRERSRLRASFRPPPPSPPSTE